MYYAVATLFLLCNRTAVTLATVLVLVHCAYMIGRSSYQFAVHMSINIHWHVGWHGLG
jgi:hypothetical protein